MTRIRDIANILSSSTNMATDAEVTSAISAQFVAGKNKIINGDFGIWQRGTSFTSSGYTADRWYLSRNNTTTVSQQTFTPGAAPVSGYEGTYFIRCARTSGSSDDYLLQRVEDMRLFAGQVITFSFWAKADTATTISQVYLACNAGSGGSGAPGGVGNFSGVSVTTSWARYTVTTTMASIAGTTIGTSSFIEVVFKFAAAMGNRTIDIWGVQVEAGSTATNFTTATGTIQGELAACQRYYQTSFDLGQTPAHNASYFGEMTLSCVNGGFNTNSYGAILFPTKMRTTPTVNIWNTRNASVSGNSARFYNSGTAYDTSSIDMGITTSSSHGLTFKGANIGSSAIVFFGYSASAEL